MSSVARMGIGLGKLPPARAGQSRSRSLAQENDTPATDAHAEQSPSLPKALSLVRRLPSAVGGHDFSPRQIALLTRLHEHVRDAG